MDRVVHREAPPVPKRPWIVLGLWILLILVLLGFGAHLLYVAIAAFITYRQVHHLLEMKKCEYVLEVDQLKLFLGEKIVAQIAIDHIEEYHRGSFTEILRIPSLKNMPSRNITAIPKLAGEKLLVVLIYKDVEHKEGEHKKALVLKPSLALSLALEEMVQKKGIGSENN